MRPKKYRNQQEGDDNLTNTHPIPPLSSLQSTPHVKLTVSRLIAIAALSLTAIVSVSSFSVGGGTTLTANQMIGSSFKGIEKVLENGPRGDEEEKKDNKEGGRGISLPPEKAEVDQKAFSRQSEGNRIRIGAHAHLHHGERGSDNGEEGKRKQLSGVSSYREAATNQLQSMVCPDIAPPTTFKNLTHFPFWGTVMNTSSACPTSGMNNQISMLLGLIHCASKQRSRASFAGLGALSGTEEGIVRIPRELVRTLRNGDTSVHEDFPSSSTTAEYSSVSLPFHLFRFKDISCTPTGGKEGRKTFKVGSQDYDYAWFRWSEIFDVHGVGALNGLMGTETQKRDSPAAPRICLRDHFSWSEHTWMKSKGCATTVDHFYGTEVYWRLRSLLPLHRWYYDLAAEFLNFSREGKESRRLAEAESGKTRREQRAEVPEDPNLEEERGKQHLKLGRSERGAEKEESSTSSLDAQRNGGEMREKLTRLHQKKTLAIHVRRGDYANFCQGTASSSGVKKFRIAPFVWMKRGRAKSEEQGLVEMRRQRDSICCGPNKNKKGRTGKIETNDEGQTSGKSAQEVGLGRASGEASGDLSGAKEEKREEVEVDDEMEEIPHYNAAFLNITSVSSLSSKFMDSCAPSDGRVMNLVEKVLADNWRRCEGGGGDGEEVNGDAEKRGDAGVKVFKLRKQGGAKGRHDHRDDDSIECIDTLLVMTNSLEFYAKIRDHFGSIQPDSSASEESSGNKHRRGETEGFAAAARRSIGKAFHDRLRSLRVISFKDWMLMEDSGEGLGKDGAGGERDAAQQISSPRSSNYSFDDSMRKVQWPSRNRIPLPSPLDNDRLDLIEEHRRRSTLTTTELSVIDVALLSLANTVILNRYSTFSQSAIDFRAVREGTLRGLRLYWW